MMVVEETELEAVDIQQDGDEEVEETEEYIEEEIEATDDHKFFLVKEITGGESVLSLPASGHVPVYKQDGLQSYMEVLAMLKKLSPNDPGITQNPPQKPIVAGQVYVYALVPGQSAYDWRFDGFQWVNLRANSFPKKNAKPILTRHEFRLLDNGVKVDFYRHEYHEPGHSFKTPINVANWKYPYIIIHYFGNFPVNEAQLAPHAGRRNGGGPCIRPQRKTRSTSKDILLPLNNPLARAINSAVASIAEDDEMEDSQESAKRKTLTDLMDDDDSSKRARVDPLLVYGALIEAEGPGPNCKVIDLTQLAQLTANGIEVTGPNLKHRHLAATPRRAKSNQSGLQLSVTKDDIYGCYVFHESFPPPNRVIRKLDFTNGSNIIIAERHLLQHINTLSSLEFLDGKLGFTYQVTAKLYRFIVTTLFVRHPIFETQPNIPVAVLLHRKHDAETHGGFFRTVKELIPILNSPDIDLIIFDEPGVTKGVENELPEIPTVHVSDPNGARASNAKLDYILVSVAKDYGFDHVKMIHLVYFLQCSIYNEILRSIVGLTSHGVELQVQAKYDELSCATPSLAERLMPADGVTVLDDAITPSELVTMLSRTPPQVLGSGSDYESCSQNELQLFEGLANFFIVKDRIEWMKARGAFSVKGLGGIQYEVKLAGRTCSCTRGKACEHVLAVLIATGLLARQQQ